MKGFEPSALEAKALMYWPVSEAAGASVESAIAFERRVAAARMPFLQLLCERSTGI